VDNVIRLKGLWSRRMITTTGFNFKTHAEVILFTEAFSVVLDRLTRGIEVDDKIEDTLREVEAEIVSLRGELKKLHPKRELCLVKKWVEDEDCDP
jgi:hypothetical protein